MPDLRLTGAALEHLLEVMNGETAPPLADDPCIYCTEIRKAAKAVLGHEETADD